MEKKFKVENLKVAVFDGPDRMGQAAADFVANKLNRAIHQKGYANLILATGASQFTFLEALQKKEIDWQKITVFHLDEYKGISEDHPASFRKYLKERILDAVAPKKMYFLNGDANDIGREIRRYQDELKKHPIDVACIGIGENGHLAFNDPPVADFQDPKWVKVVALDEACRNQQLGEGWFPTFEDVPTHALTLTIPAILSSQSISCVVPDARKAEAVQNSLYGPISTVCPGSILRTHQDTALFLDTGSASGIKEIK
ncbi:glucosamine-6-phosphate deaminase [Flavobacteriaceae bacterium F89]|uniref:Glucosamine-6-phosphate deaminase n=1 Tax=Cerina litoralis TaxID=2874477 RepID=A0AAE3JQF3_9FLAO|nr:glucosamine-6-phosphate deaminase [Cerina litoralis]MCG2461804.1 glucosamine-6-phosphate deaminase [Cerina litoralis]